MLKAVLRVSTVEGVIAQIASSEVRIRFLGAPILSKQLHTAGGQKISESRGAGGYFRRVVLPCRILVASDVRRLDVGTRERTIVSHTPLGFLELPLLACAVGFHRVSFSARSRLRIPWMLFLTLSIYGLKQQYMVKTGSMLSWMAR